MQNPKQFSNYLQKVSKGGWSKPETFNQQKFAARLAQPDPEDRKWFLRSQAIQKEDGASTGKTAAGMAVAPEEFYAYLERKKDAQLYADYQAWAIKQMNTQTPEAQAYWKNILSWVSKRREEILDEQADVQKKLARIRIHGIQNEEDLQFLFALRQGLITLSNSPLYALDEATTVEKGQAPQNEYTTGMFSPYRKYFISDEFVKKEQIMNPADPYKNADSPDLTSTGFKAKFGIDGLFG